MDPLTGEVTRLLIDLRTGNKEAEDQLFTLLYDELRRLAASRLRHERPDHTLQPTELVNITYERLIEQSQKNWENRAHFMRVCACCMRHILVDHARRRKAGKHGGGNPPLPLDESILPAVQLPIDYLALDEALSRLEAFDPRQVRVVEMRYFVGMTEEEIGHVLEMSVRTVKRDWETARAWLRDEMRK
jgi:RNA polymerase sigma factor (TIGR02999 family)